jgi:hypothetical protein
MPKFEKSTRKGKKYMVRYKDKLIHFGALKPDGKGYLHYKDITGLGLYSNLDHNDPERRKRYRDRHSKILLKDGTPAYKNKNQSSYWAYYYLW